MTTTQPKHTTTDGGAPAPSDDHSLTVGPGGPILLQDHYLIEQMAQFNRERIPERQPHAKGGGAFGHFEVINDVSKYTRAAVFAPGTKTDTLIRFSTVAGERGSPDTWRDPRGFALKFYTTEGNFDLVGNPPGSGSTASIANVQVSQQPAADTFSTTALAGPFGSPASIAVADVDGDGHADVVVTDTGLNQLLVFNGNGSGGFTRSALPLSSYGTGAGALALVGPRQQRRRRALSYGAEGGELHNSNHSR